VDIVHVVPEFIWGMSVQTMQDAANFLEAAHFLEKADLCLRLGRVSGISDEIASELEAMCNEFTAKALEIDTARDKAVKAGSTTSSPISTKARRSTARSATARRPSA